MMPTNFFSLFTKSFAYGLVGFFITHLIGLTIVFSHTEYVRLRLFYEKSINFDRNSVKEKYEDYPFAHKASYLYNDLEIRNKIKKKIPHGGKNINDYGEDSVMRKKSKGFLKISHDESDEKLMDNFKSDE